MKNKGYDVYMRRVRDGAAGGTVLRKPESVNGGRSILNDTNHTRTYRTAVNRYGRLPKQPAELSTGLPEQP
jgi:hypothetical protein